MKDPRLSRPRSMASTEPFAWDRPAGTDELLASLGARVAAAAAVLGLTIAGYHAVASSVDPASAHTLKLAIDDRIPFLPSTIYLYSWVYTSMLYPLFVVRCPRLFRRTVEAYAITIGVSLAAWALYPVTAVGFRPDVRQLDTSVFHNWGVALTYFADPPHNLFPSLHLAAATLAALVAWKARPLFGLWALPVVVGVAVSISTMKQHYVVDGVAALVVVAAVYRLRLASYVSARDAVAPVAYSWRGPALYAGFHGCVYLALYLTFRAGFRPWLA